VFCFETKVSAQHKRKTVVEKCSEREKKDAMNDTSFESVHGHTLYTISTQTSSLSILGEPQASTVE
jgi:hypothetical protein